MRVLLLLFAASPVWACSCAGPKAPACQATWGESGAVFIGTVLDITAPPLVINGISSNGRRVIVHFQVTESVTGLTPGQKVVEIETGMGGGDCGYRFEAGIAYVVYASRANDGGLVTGICSRTRPLSQADEDLAYFRSLPNAHPGGDVRVELHDSDNFGSQGGDGVAGVHMTVEGGDRHYEATTGLQGRANLAGLPPGEYRVRGMLDGYLPFERTIQLHDKGCAQVFQVMVMDRRVMGRVLGKDGQPVAGVTIEAVPIRPSYRSQRVPIAADTVQTDTEGNYEFSHLRVGDYYLGVNITISPGRNSPFRRLFYPGVEDPKLATIIHVAHVPGTQQLNFSLPERLPLRFVQGTVLLPNGQPAANASVYLVDPHVPWGFSERWAHTDVEGRFQLQGIDGAESQIYAVSSQGNRRDGIHSQLLDVPWGSDTLHLRLILNSDGPTIEERINQVLEGWRQGLGL